MSRLFGWDLPPGCSTRDLPGNSAAEQDAEAFYDAMYDQFPAGMSDEDMEKVANWVWDKVNKAYGDGYAQANADAAEAREYAKLPEEE